MTNKKIIISNYLKDLGIPVSCKGFHYLRYGVELMINDISLMNAITTCLYPEIAKRFNTGHQNIERCIRHAIATGWSRGNRVTQEKLFGYTVDENLGMPTNSEFIVTVADYYCMTESEDANT